MKTSSSTVKQGHKPIFLTKVTKPHVFSKLIHNHASVLNEENHLTVVPHQILHPDYDPRSPKLKIELPEASQASVNSSSKSNITDRTSQNFSQSLPRRRPFKPRSEYLKDGNISSCSSNCETDVDDIELLLSSSQRPTIMELEAILVREKTKLKKIQQENDASQKVYSKTKKQMKIKIIENQQRIGKLMDSIKQARQNLETVHATVPATPVIRHRTNSSSSEAPAPPVPPQAEELRPSSSIPPQRKVSTLATTNTPFSYDNGTVDYI